MKFLICHHLNTNTNFLVGLLAYQLSCIFFGMFWESLSQAECKKNFDVHHISEFEGGGGVLRRLKIMSISKWVRYI